MADYDWRSAMTVTRWPRTKQKSVPSYADAMLKLMGTETKTATGWSHVIGMTPSATLARLVRLHDVRLVRRIRRKVSRYVEVQDWTISEHGKKYIFMPPYEFEKTKAGQHVEKLKAERLADDHYDVHQRQRRTLGQ